MSTNATEGTVYDFRKPRQLDDDVESLVSQWQSALASQTSDAWDSHLGLAVRWLHKELDTTQMSSVLTSWESEESPGFVIGSFRVDGNQSGTALAIPRPVILGALTVLIGETIEEMPADRELSDLELSIVEMAFQSIAQQITDSQPCTNPMMVEFISVISTRECSRLFNAQEPLVQSRFTLSTEFGESDAFAWINQETILELLTRVSESRPENEDADRIKETLKDVPIPLVVQLGETRVGVTELMNMQPGDVLMLEQGVNEPLTVEIGSRTMFHAWPGRVGNRQAIQISQVVEKESNAN